MSKKVELFLPKLNLHCTIKSQNTIRIFLCEQLDEIKPFTCDEDLRREEDRLAKLEEEYLIELHF